MSSSRRSGDDHLRSRVVRGLGWKVTSQVVLQISRIAVGLLLARLLTPAEYGLAGMVLVASGFVIVFSDLALGAALVQRRTLTEADRSTVFWTGAAVGLGFTVLGVAASGLVARFYGNPEVAPLFAVFSLSFLITSLGTTQKALFTRELDFKSLELRLIIGSLAGGVVGVVAAAKGYGAWAIIAQQLTIAIGSTVLLWLASSWRPRLSYSLASLRDLGGFSAHVFGTRLVYYLHENAASLLIGRFLGAASLGIFAAAYQVILVPLSRIAVPVGEVLNPAFARMQDDRARLGKTWIRAVRLLAAVCIPACLGLAIVAPDFVAVVLGERWKEAAPVIQVLALVGMLQSLSVWNSGVLMALDRAEVLFRYSLLFLAAHVTAFTIGLQWGVLGVAVAYAVSTTLVEPLYWWLTARVADVSVRSIARSLAGVVQASLVMGVTLVLVRTLAISEGIGPGLRLAILVPLGIVVYLAASAWRTRELVAELRALRPSASTVAARP